MKSKEKKKIRYDKNGYKKEKCKNNRKKNKCVNDYDRILSLIINLLIVLSIVFGVIIGYRLTSRYNTYKNINSNVVIEYGEVLKLSDIIKNNYIGGSVKVSPSLDSITDIGKYNVNLIIHNESFDISVEVVDRTPPTLELKELSVYIDEDMPSVDDFIGMVNDLSEVTLNDIDIKKEVGVQNISITATDKYGNKTIKNTTLTIKEDKDAPVISGLSDIVIYIGDKVNLYDGVLAVDDRFGNVEFTIDESSVDYNKVGTYYIKYTAEDKLGNSITKDRKIIIKQRDITYMINDFPTYNQYPDYPNGCESIALYTLLKYYSINVSPDDIVDKLKKGEGPYFEDGKLYGGDPEIEFVGNPREYNGYGVYQKPIIEVANYYKSGIIDYTGHTLNEVLELVKNGKPVQIWGSIDMSNTYVSKSWINKENGKTIYWIRNLHSVVVVGYNSNYVYVADPYVGSIVKYNRYQVEKMYNLFGKRAIYYDN